MRFNANLTSRSALFLDLRKMGVRVKFLETARITGRADLKDAVKCTCNLLFDMEIKSISGICQIWLSLIENSIKTSLK